MSVEILRRAAALMRDRASYADKGPWMRRGSDCQCCDDLFYANGHLIASGVDVINAEHIASWHPAVALAVADWLDEAADHLEAHRDMDALPEGATCPTAREGMECSVLEQALTVARAYLGEQP